MITNIELENFTAFDKLNMTCSPGINVIIGPNGTGKTHVMELAYVLVAAASKKKQGETDQYISRKMLNVFKPGENLYQLHASRDDIAVIKVFFSHDQEIEFYISETLNEVTIGKNSIKQKTDNIPVFIPPKEVISTFPGFASLYSQREMAIDETYYDLCRALELSKLKQVSSVVNPLIKAMKEACGGEFILNQALQRFYYKPVKGRMLEAELAAEGWRKLGTLQRLMQNGSINPGKSGPLFWDEPESNLNPRLMKTVVDALLKLARAGQQIFIATHDYVILKEIDLQMNGTDQVMFHSLYKDSDSGEIALTSTTDYLQIFPNAIDDTYAMSAAAS